MVAKSRTRLSDFTLLRARSGLCSGNTKELRADWREAGTLGFKPGLSLDILICLTCLQTGLQGPTMDGYTKGVEGGVNRDSLVHEAPHRWKQVCIFTAP